MESESKKGTRVAISACPPWRLNTKTKALLPDSLTFVSWSLGSSTFLHSARERTLRVDRGGTGQLDVPSYHQARQAYNVAPGIGTWRKLRIDMGDPIDIPGGELSIAPDKSAPLLVVFGGIPVSQTEFDGIKRKKPIYVLSGVYMWNYMSALKSKFHIFVAANTDVHGDKAYDALLTALTANGIDPSQSKPILYLFSGGYKPGIELLGGSGADRFSSIFLVDIWMGFGKKNPTPFVPNFYKHLVNAHADMITYVFTSFGANNDDARDSIAKKLGSQKAILVGHQGVEDGMQTHLRTNTVAVGMLP